MSSNLGRVDILGAEAIGQPGQRRFRIFASSLIGSVIIWAEKEYLNDLSLALDRVLAQLTDGKLLRTEAQAGGKPPLPVMPEDFPTIPSFEFQVGQVGLTYDEEDRIFSLIAMPLEIIMGQEHEPAARIREDQAVSFQFTHQQAHTLTSTIAVLVTAGRPFCPFCHKPLDDSPHACVKQNGHHEIELVEANEEDDEE